MQDTIQILVQTEKKHIAFITKIFEAMGHLAIVTTLDREAGLLRILCDPGSRDEVVLVLETLPCRQVVQPEIPPES